MGGKIKNVDPTTFAGPKKPPSGYFAYCNDNRTAVVERLKAEAAAKGEKFSVTAVGKAIGDMWKAASDEEKTKYDMAAKEAKSAYDAQMKDWKKTEDYKKYLEAQGQVAKKKMLKRTNDEIKAAKPASHPEKPQPAYFVFNMECQATLSAELEALGQGKGVKERATLVKQKWEALPAEDKAAREAKYQADKAEYAEKMKAWEETPEAKEWAKLKQKCEKRRALTAKHAKERVKNAGKEDDEEVEAEAEAEAEGGAELEEVSPDGDEGEEAGEEAGGEEAAEEAGEAAAEAAA